MRKLLYAFLIVGIIAACSIFGSDGSDRFGAWEKVSDDRGEYRGIDSPSKIASVAFASSSADTIQIDTSFVNSDEQLNLSVEPYPHGPQDFDISLTIIDSNKTFVAGSWNMEYATDSTAFNSELNSMQQTDEYMKLEARLIRNCAQLQGENEHIIFSYTDRDSSESKVFDVNVTGLVDISDDILNSCRD